MFDCNVGLLENDGGALLYVWIGLAAAGGLVAAWPLALAWSMKHALFIASKVVERDFDGREEAYRALDELHREHVRKTKERSKK